jgi:CRISPR-associated protein Cas1
MLLVRLEGERLVIQRQGATLGGVPLHEISHVVSHGPVTFTGAAVAALLERGVDVALLSSGGQFRGVIHGAHARNVFLTLAQVACWNEAPRRLALARLLVASKLEGQRRMLQRAWWDRGLPELRQAIEQIDRLRKRLDEMQTDDELRGLEGAASAAYFGVFDRLLTPPWSFPGRVRRPPTDPVNSLLSFGYTLAVAEVSRHLLHRGFDPRIGLFHGLRYGRESLALDLVEEFRAPMVDRFVLRSLNRAQLTAAHFETRPDGAVRLSLQGRRVFMPLWEALLSERAAKTQRNRSDEEQEEREEAAEGDEAIRVERGATSVPEPTGKIVSWRHRIERQVSRLHRFLLKQQPYRTLLSERPADPGAPAALPPGKNPP